MGDEGNEQGRLGFTAGRGWALEAGPVEKEVARGLAGGLTGLLGSLLPLPNLLAEKREEKKG